MLRIKKRVIGIFALSFACTAFAGNNLWTVQGPDGAAPIGFAAAPSLPTRVYMNTSAGLHRSDDGGTTWSLINSYPETESGQIFVDPNDPDTVYIAHDQLGFFASADAGVSFVPRHSDLPDSPFSSTPALTSATLTSDGRFYVDTFGSGIWVTQDQGATWTQRSTGLPEGTFFDYAPVAALAAAPGNPDRLIAAVENEGLFYTNDGGLQWEMATSGPTLFDTGFDLALNPFDPQNAILLIRDFAITPRLYATIDGGQNWALLKAANLAGRVISVTYDATIPNRVYAGAGNLLSADTGMFTSDDEGKTFALESELGSREAGFVGPLTAFANGDVMVGTSEGTYQRNPADGKWTFGSIGVLGKKPQFLAASASESGRVFAGSGSEVRVSNSAASDFTPGTDEIENQIAPGFFVVDGGLDTDRDILFAATTASDFYKSTDQGATWVLQSDWSNSLEYIEALDIVTHESATAIVAARSFAGIFRSFDDGQTWEDLNSPATPFARAVAIKPNDTQVILASGFTGGLYRTENGGEQWSDITPASQTGAIAYIEFDPHNPEVVYAGGSCCVDLKSTDAGATWEPFLDTPAQANGRVIAMEFHPSEQGLIYVAGGNTETGVWRSVNNGASWESLAERDNMRLGSASGSAPKPIRVDPTNTYRIYAATDPGVAVYELSRDLSVTVSPEETTVTLADLAQYRVRIFNGPGTAGRVTLKLDAVANAVPVSVSSNDCEIVGLSVNCSLESLSSIGLAFFDVSYRPSNLGPVRLAVEANSLETDPDPSNDEFTDLSVTVIEADVDGDGQLDTQDNCLFIANPDQRDSNGDGFGNRCDGDLNNDGLTNVLDLGLLRSVFFTSDADADINGDGTVNVQDLGLFRTLFFLPPGPSGLDLTP
ncbi:MAG: YCF48-related protein [Gammaproteobacteria bacterium]